MSKEEISAIARILQGKQREEVERYERWGAKGPPMNLVIGGRRLVAAYNQLLPIRENATYHDFLLAFVRHIFGHDWWDAEKGKDQNEQHQMIRWEAETIAMMDANGGGEQLVHVADMPASTGKLLNLSFALHQIRHQGLLLPSLVKRLMDHRQFQGAYYEAIVSAAFSRAGFEVKLEPEGKDDRKRCEFVATHPDGKQYSVEAKSRHRPGILGQPEGEGSEKPEPYVEKLILKALEKHADHDRVICVDVNHPQPEGQFPPDWANTLEQQIHRLEANGHGPAILIFTNSPFHYQEPQARAQGQNSMVASLSEARFEASKINETRETFPGLIEVAEAFNMAIPGRWD